MSDKLRETRGEWEKKWGNLKSSPSQSGAEPAELPSIWHRSSVRFSRWLPCLPATTQYNHRWTQIDSRVGLGRTRPHGPCFPSPLHSFRAADFPQHGWKCSRVPVALRSKTFDHRSAFWRPPACVQALVASCRGNPVRSNISNLAVNRDLRDDSDRNSR